jgi:hypothetical protein
MALRVEAWMRDELERRKQLWRDLFAGRPLERAPVDVRPAAKPAHSTRAQFQDGDKQLEVALAGALETWKVGELTDTVPAMRPDVGCSCLATAFGGDYYWGETEDQTPGIRAPVVRDLEADLHRLPDPDPERDGWLREGMRRIRLFAEAGEGFIPVSLLDAAGGLNVAADLLGATVLLESLYTAPLAVHALLSRIQRLYIATIRAGILAAGGEANITTTDFPDFWFPDGWKGHASDDISASFGPATYREFSAPYHAQVFAVFGAGGLHNCGPNPCHAEYVAHAVSPRSLDLADAYSHADLPALRRSLRRRAFIYLSLDRTRTAAASPEAWYREVMELMAPEVLVVPVVTAADVAEARDLGARFAPIAHEYASRMEWGWEDSGESPVG